MENSILQLALDLGKKFLEKATIENISDIDSLAASLKEDCINTAAKALECIVSEANRQIREDKKSRKDKGLVLHEKNRPRELFTELGTINISRDNYYDKNSRKYVYVLDGLIGVEPYARIGDTIKARLVSESTKKSYAQSAKDVTGGRISRQSVANAIRMAPILQKQVEEKREVGELHIYADEDHVHLQKPGKGRGKKNRMVPLVTVTEGRKTSGSRRKANKEAMHFVDRQFDAKQLWENVDGYIQTAYEAEKIERICIHGDGGKWIQRGLEGYANVIHVFDGWHFNKELRSISSRFRSPNASRRIKEAIKKDDKGLAKKEIEQLRERAKTPSERKALEDFEKYLMGHWEAINRRLTGLYPGSCTEGLVSHVLSERFSRNPMGWSEENLGKLSALRVYVLNGGEITAADFRGRTKVAEEEYKDWLRGLLNMRHEGLNWDIFESEKYSLDVSSGTHIAIKGIGRSVWLN